MMTSSPEMTSLEGKTPYLAIGSSNTIFTGINRLKKNLSTTWAVYGTDYDDVITGNDVIRRKNTIFGDRI